MTLVSLAILGLTICATSFIAGIFGMAGGMILLGVLLVYFDVATAMVVFSLLQFSANMSRVLLWRKFILWPVFFQFVIGGTVAFGIMRMIAFIPDKAVVYLVLGSMPFMVEALPRAWRPNIEWRFVPYVCGLRHHRGAAHRRQRRAFSRRLLPEEPARPQDHGRHQGDRAYLRPCVSRRLFRGAGRRARRERRAAAVGGRGRDRARHRRHLARARWCSTA